MPGTIPLGPKPVDYYGQPRVNLIDELPRPLGRVLDVGCGEGGAGDQLRAAGAESITGIEIMPGPAAEAEKRYDQVEVGDALEALDRLDGLFDTILCYDVLEHLVDPVALARGLRGVSRRHGRLHVSVPNARHFSLLRDLVVRGTFGYTEWGHRDATHLRWFTRRDIVALLEETGWSVRSTTPSAAHKLQELGLPAPPRLVGAGGEFFAGQWYVLAEANGSA